jgi:ABC-type sugar transport system permease subunit
MEAIMNFVRIKRNSAAYLFLAPFIIGFLIFGLYPVVNTLALSFTDATLMSKSSHIIGLNNFKRLFADEVFMRAVGNTW